MVDCSVKYIGSLEERLSLMSALREKEAKNAAALRDVLALQHKIAALRAYGIDSHAHGAVPAPASLSRWAPQTPDLSLVASPPSGCSLAEQPEGVWLPAGCNDLRRVKYKEQESQ
ncbi:hypothetical protein HK101_002812, partial [Irineochytrium annulatum]